MKAATLQFPAILPHGIDNPDPRPGAYYVTATDDGLRTHHRLLGPFDTHAEALSWVERVRAYCRRHGGPRAVWMAYGTICAPEGTTQPGTANRYLLTT